MDDTLIINLKESLVQGDVLYFLGDLTFKEKSAQEFFKTFSDLEIHYIIGNHDSLKVINIARKNCVSVSRLLDIKIENQPITLCHFAMRVWNKSHFNSWQLFGHSHGSLTPIGKQHDVGVDVNGYFPISFDFLKQIMETRPDNFNLIYLKKNKQ